MITRTDPRTGVTEAHAGRCDAANCSCPAYVESINIAGWPSCVRDECRHTENIHAWIEVHP